MLGDITFGKYYNTQSVLHRVDGRISFFRFVVFMVSVITIKNPLCFIPATVFIFTLILLSRIPLIYIFKGVWGARWYIGMCVVLSVLSDFTLHGLVKGGFLLVRLFLLVTSASLFTLTTTLSHICDTFEWYLSPLKYLGVPVRDIAVMLSIAIRFLPVLVDEAVLIINAQKARGAQVGQGSWFKRAKNVIPLLIPIFASAIRRAADLSDAIKARAYGYSSERTRLNPLKFKSLDIIALLVVLLYLALIIWGNNYGC